jgi:nitrate/nitrite-specific signal transduction histidine kinase
MNRVNARQPDWSFVRSLFKPLVRAKGVFAFSISRLRIKLAAILTISMLLGLGVSSLLILTWQRQELTEQAEADALRVSAVIEASLLHSMVNHDSAMIASMLQVETDAADLKYARVLDLNGRVWMSSNPSQVGQPVELTGLPCRDCDPNTPESRRRTLIVDDCLIVAKVIPSQAVCLSCHDSTSKNLGLVQVAESLDSLNAQLTVGWWRIALSSFVMFVLMVGLLMPALEKLVTRPIMQLAKGAEAIRFGNLEHTCRVNSNDELGALAGSFDAMRQQLKTVLERTEQKNQELRMINDIARITSEQLEPQQILDLTIKAVVNSLQVQAGAIRLHAYENGQAALHGCHGVLSCDPQACDLRAMNIALMEPANPDCVSTLDATFSVKPDAQGRSYIGIPLQARGLLVGGLTLITHPGQSVTQEGIRVLKAMGQQIGIAVLNAMRFQHARSEATLEERERLAREMHDSLAQALGYLKMKASLTDELLSGGQIAKAQVNLREVKEIAGETYLDVREAIFGLRNTFAQGTQFLPGLIAYLDKYQLHYGFAVQLIAPDDCCPSFSPETSLQLTRIIQEALMNVRKHAGTDRATIHFARIDRQWQIAIEDHGHGFDPHAIRCEGSQFLGLHIMQERALGIGGELAIETKSESGTRVLIRVPIESGG